MAESTCAVLGCPGADYARGWCSKHYQRWKRHGDPHVRVQLQGEPEEDRFFLNVAAPDGPLRCWYWTAGLDEDGYGHFRDGRSKVRAHRFAWTLFRGEIPPGLVIDHECRVRRCVNPWHLDPVTPSINTRRAAWWLDAGMCKRGHIYTPATERFTTSGSRYCLACSNDLRRLKRLGLSAA